MNTQVEPYNDFESIVHDMNREQNINYLQRIVGRVLVMNDIEDPRVHLPNIGISFQYQLVNEFPFRFRSFIDAIVLRVAEERSANQRKPVKSVSENHGRQFFLTQKLFDKIKSPPNCSICLEPLIPEGMKRKKVWKLECGCMFHKRPCIKRWFKESSNCPNCRHDCSSE